MKFMVTWSIPPGSHKASAERFLKSGAPLPPGIEAVGRWHAPGSAYGWLLVEGDDTTALAQHMAEWSDYMELQVTPVIEDADAAAGLGKAYGR